MLYFQDFNLVCFIWQLYLELVLQIYVGSMYFNSLPPIFTFVYEFELFDFTNFCLTTILLGFRVFCHFPSNYLVSR